MAETAAASVTDVSVAVGALVGCNGSGGPMELGAGGEGSTNAASQLRMVVLTSLEVVACLHAIAVSHEMERWPSAALPSATAAIQLVGR